MTRVEPKVISSDISRVTYMRFEKRSRRRYCKNDPFPLFESRSIWVEVWFRGRREIV